MPEYQIPARVLENAEKRLAASARARRRQCRHCDHPATHWPCTAQPACETHRGTAQPPVSDPRRRLYALRDRAITERQHLAEDQLLTVRISYRWASEERAAA